MSWKPLLSLSLGAAALLPATTALADDFVLDLAELNVSLGEVRNETDKGIDNKYVVRVKGTVIGATARPDRVVVDWKAGGKTLATVECDADASDGYAGFECIGNEASALDTYGPVEAVVSYVDDSEDQTHVLHTMNLEVGRFWNWYQRGKKTLHYPKYQVVPADLLGSAIVWHRPENGEPDNPRLEFFTWSVHGEGNELEGETLRCSVDGKKLGDFPASGGGELSAETIEWLDVNGPKRELHWYRHRIGLGGVLAGKAATLRREYGKYGPAPVMLGDHPGAWSCDWRGRGKVLRTFAFVVGADGRVQPHAEQKAGLVLPTSEAMVDVVLPAEVPDLAFDPKPLTAGGFYGRPWKAAGTVTAMKLPKAKGAFVQAPPKGAKGGKPAKK